MSKNIYEQAIADAKKLREIAEQNAKNAIIEAVTPRVRELIENELSGNGDNNGDFINEGSYYNNDEIILDESAILELAKEVAGNKTISESKNTMSDFISEISSDTDYEDKELEENIDTDEDTMNEDDVFTQSNEEDEDAMLEELLSEIKLEIDLDVEDENIEQELLGLLPTIKIVDDSGEPGEDIDELPEEEYDMDMDMDSEMGDMDMDMEGGDEMDMDDMELPSAPGEGGMDDDEEMEESYVIDEGILARELQKLKENRKRKSTRSNRSKLNEGSNVKRQLIKEQRNNRLLKERLEEYRGAVEQLRDQLNEMNLFNAKLLYVNKLLQTKGLDASQKKTIIESIDNAESFREVKLLYKTLSESIIRKAKNANTISESKIRKMTSSSSKPTRSGSTGSKERNGLLTESSAQVDRWATLAGIK